MSHTRIFCVNFNAVWTAPVTWRLAYWSVVSQKWSAAFQQLTAVCLRLSAVISDIQADLIILSPVPLCDAFVAHFWILSATVVIYCCRQAESPLHIYRWFRNGWRIWHEKLWSSWYCLVWNSSRFAYFYWCDAMLAQYMLCRCGKKFEANCDLVDKDGNFGASPIKFLNWDLTFRNEATQESLWGCLRRMTWRNFPVIYCASHLHWISVLFDSVVYYFY